VTRNNRRPGPTNITPAKTILACDVGGTRVKLGVVRDGRLLAQTKLDAGAKLRLAAALKRGRGQKAGPESGPGSLILLSRLVAILQHCAS
jgi:pantothenate kinase type III